MILRTWRTVFWSRYTFSRHCTLCQTCTNAKEENLVPLLKVTPAWPKAGRSTWRGASSTLAKESDGTLDALESIGLAGSLAVSLLFVPAAGKAGAQIYLGSATSHRTLQHLATCSMGSSSTIAATLLDVCVSMSRIRRWHRSSKSASLQSGSEPARRSYEIVNCSLPAKGKCISLQLLHRCRWKNQPLKLGSAQAVYGFQKVLGGRRITERPTNRVEDQRGLQKGTTLGTTPPQGR